MAKDPAFLFYPNDWIGGTMGMTFEEKGAYMELLMMQFNRGHMTSHMIGQTVGQLWGQIKDKFIQDEAGQWYNQRLEIEQEKRKTFTESRRNNIKGINQYSKKDNKSSHMSGHVTTHMENENENENKENIGGTGGKEENEQPAVEVDHSELIVPRMLKVYRDQFPKYLFKRDVDFPALYELARSLCDYQSLKKDFENETIIAQVLKLWTDLVCHIKENSHYSTYNLAQVRKYIQSIIQSYNKPPAPSKSGLQYLYERHCEGAQIGKLLTEEHFTQLQELGLVAYPDQTMLDSIYRTRLLQLQSSNDAAEKRLFELHTTGTNCDEVRQDQLRIILKAKKTVVMAFFKRQKAAKAVDVLKV